MGSQDLGSLFSYFNQLFVILDKHFIMLGKIRLSPLVFVKTLFFLVCLMWGVRFVSGRIERVLMRVVHNSSNRALAIKISDTFLYFLGFLMALRIVGLDLATFSILGGAFGIGIGFGLQKVTSNFISGMILLTEKSIEVDDLIELGDGIYGWVRRLGARYTLVETWEGKEVMVPNEDFITNRVTNWTFSNTQGRIKVTVGVSYDSDIKLAKQLILDAATEHPQTLESPEPECYLVEFGDSSVNFVLFFWVPNVSTGRFLPKSQVMMAIWDKFHANNIRIPYPQRDVYIKQLPESVSHG